MSSVVRFAHQGVECAVPAAQVEAGAGEAGDDPPIVLFRPEEPPGPARRMLRVRTPLGARRVPCDGARFGRLDGGAMQALPELLRDALGLPHVVGLADADGGLVWLVDFSRWENA